MLKIDLLLKRAWHLERCVLIRTMVMHGCHSPMVIGILSFSNHVTGESVVFSPSPMRYVRTHRCFLLATGCRKLPRTTTTLLRLFERIFDFLPRSLMYSGRRAYSHAITKSRMNLSPPPSSLPFTVFSDCQSRWRCRGCWLRPSAVSSYYRSTLTSLA